MKYIIALIALLALTLPAFSQSSVGTGNSPGRYSVIPISLPVGALTTAFYVTNGSGVITTSTVPYYTAGTTATNLAAGWSSSVITTNVSIVYTNSGNLVTNTTYVTNTSTFFANFSSFFSRNVPLQLAWAGATNVAFTCCKSVDGVLYDTNAIQTITFSSNTWPGVMGAENTNIVMDGIGYGRILSITVTGTLNMTNPQASFGQKQNAP